MAAAELLAYLLVEECPTHAEPQRLCDECESGGGWPVFNLFVNYTKE